MVSELIRNQVYMLQIKYKLADLIRKYYYKYETEVTAKILKKGDVKNEDGSSITQEDLDLHDDIFDKMCIAEKETIKKEIGIDLDNCSVLSWATTLDELLSCEQNIAGDEILNFIDTHNLLTDFINTVGTNCYSERGTKGEYIFRMAKINAFMDL